jgi:hypothetical protein
MITPVLFLVFNRLDTTRKVFDIIRKARPPRLYIASDGPRDVKVGEEEEVLEIRNYILENIDWDCIVKTLFRDKNLGCGKAVSEAITWFFENEERGIILEDDCLPSLSFFIYCEELLEKYKEDERIYHIAGFNPLEYIRNNFRFNYSYYFARIQHCWGWATWRRAWIRYSYDITDLHLFIKNKVISRIFSNGLIGFYWIWIFKMMRDRKINTWDYQWTYTIYMNDGICINPVKNMIINLGFNQTGTHTTLSSNYFNSQRKYELEDIICPDDISIDKEIIKKIATGHGWSYLYKRGIEKIMGL